MTRCAAAVSLYRLPGTVDPLPLVGSSDANGIDAPYAVCLPCIKIGVGDLTVCVSQNDCLADQGQPADLSGTSLEGALNATQIVVAMSIQPIVGVSKGEDGLWKMVFHPAACR